jgi:hypothetical protein
MPQMPLPQFIFLASAITAFVTFAVVLFGVSVYVGLKGSDGPKGVEREVIPARRAKAGY